VLSSSGSKSKLNKSLRIKHFIISEIYVHFNLSTRRHNPEDYTNFPLSYHFPNFCFPLKLTTVGDPPR
jgi:hypothetical protein